MGIKNMDEQHNDFPPAGMPNVTPRIGIPTKPTQSAGNPLAKHFRQPAIYISLPSRGQFWEPNSLEIPESNEVAVYPMTTKDEITLRTPDALMNGQGVVEVIQSCIPAIKNAWKMPSVDTDVTLIALRIASYGHNMEFEGTCPKCNESHNYGMDLRNLMSTIKCPDYNKIMDLQAVNIKFKPQSYLQTTHIGQAQFELQRYEKMMNQLDDDDLAEKTKLAGQQVKRLNELAIDVLVNSTDYVIDVESQAKIDRKDYIKEFYNNVDTKVIQEINEWLGELIKDSNPKMQKVNCAGCGEEIELQIIFDYANFFAVGF
jgi:hypothetical protein